MLTGGQNVKTSEIWEGIRKEYFPNKSETVEPMPTDIALPIICIGAVLFFCFLGALGVS
jgi:hypothetical protein